MIIACLFYVFFYEFCFFFFCSQRFNGNAKWIPNILLLIYVYEITLLHDDIYKKKLSLENSSFFFFFSFNLFDKKFII